MMRNFHNQYAETKSIPVVKLVTLKHGQEVHRTNLILAFESAMQAGVSKFMCINDKQERRSVEISGALKCLSAIPEARTLVVSCDKNGFIFKLTKSQKKMNLLKNGRTEEKADELLKDDLDILYPYSREEIFI
ncbi:MAG: hypothetical protein EOM67_13145 [Spirochaetia bacterium]|nr:hypothetical protein [Spirochaetia bacterium]